MDSVENRPLAPAGPGAHLRRVTASPAVPRRLQRTVSMMVLGVLVVFVLVYILLPFYWMLKSSLQTNAEIMAIPPIWIPRSLSLDAYQTALSTVPLARYLANSLFVSLVTTVVCTFLACMAGYALARFRFPFATLILMAFLFAQLVPPITRIFPVYFLMKDFGLLNTYQGLIIAYVGFTLPYATLMLQAYFRGSYPIELEEAAMIDGCTLFGAFLRVVLPVSVPGIVAIATFSFLGAWNDFLWASLLLYQGDMKTIQVGLRDFIGEMGLQKVNAFMAACVMATVPAIILFRLVQRNIVQGVSAGAVKG